MNKPPELKFGPKALRKWAKEICKSIVERTPLSGDNVEVDEKPDGVAVNYSSSTPNGGSKGTTETFVVIHLGELMYQDVYVSGPPRPIEDEE